MEARGEVAGEGIGRALAVAPAIRPQPPAQPIPLERISGGYDSVARLLIPVCPPTWVKFQVISAPRNSPVVNGTCPRR